MATRPIECPYDEASGFRFNRGYLVLDTPTTNYFAAQHKNEFEVLPELLTASQNNAIFMKHGDFTWWHWLDTTVSELRSGSWYPQYNDIYQKWFGIDAPPQKFYLK